jgi:hypothetical protein
MDMDGTLLDGNQQIPRRNTEVLKLAVARGVHIAVCSGRTASDISFYVSDAGLTECHILSLNGTCCLLRPHESPYFVKTIDPDAAEAAINVFLAHRITFAGFQQDRVIIVNGEEDVHKKNWGTYVARGNANAFEYGAEAIANRRAEGFCKLVYIDHNHSPRILRVRESLAGIDGLTVTSSWTNNLEIIPAGVNKGTALRALAGKLSIPREQVMAIGDFDNDLDMIEYAGFGVAMGNGSERVKKAARYVAPDNERFGVAEAVLRFVLET